MQFSLCQVAVAVQFSLVWGSGGYSSCHAHTSHCSSFSRCGAAALGCTSFGSWSFQVLVHRLNSVVHRLSCSMADGIYLAWGSNLCLLGWQADSSPLSHSEAQENKFNTF